MKKFSLAVVIVALGISATLSVQATDLGAGIKFGTPGFGAEMTIGLKEEWNARAGVNFFAYGMSETSDDDSDEVTGDLRLLTVPVLVDWHPSGGGFRLTAGLVFNANRIDLSGSTDDDVEIGDGTYFVSDLDGEATFSIVAPYVGIGVGNAVVEGVHVAFDLGVMFQGTAQIDLNATARDPGQQAALDADLKKEEADIEDEAALFTMYPVLSLGISFAF